MKALIIGAGNSRAKKLSLTGSEVGTIVSLDIDKRCKPDVVWDLNNLPYPFETNEFDEIHAYEVMEHVGQQGDWKFFFAQFDELARILKPDGKFFGTSPKHGSPWVWGDPGHTRYFGPECLVYLDRREYVQQIGKTSMTDYRGIFTSNWERIFMETKPDWDSHAFILKNIKEK